MSRKGRSLLKKSLSAQSMLHKRLETSPKYYENVAFNRRTGGRKGHEGVFQQARPFMKHSYDVL